MRKTAFMVVAGAALIVTTGCASNRNSNLSAPDEFRVVTKAPLVIPPDFNLRPPTSGQALPAEVSGGTATSSVAFGSQLGQNASAGERALVAAANANAVNPIVRTQVDFEEARVIRKSGGISDRIMFWRNDDGSQETGDSATGGEGVTIERGSGDRLKLPGT
ncbi:MAG: DUF3035 domain-containing protein [Pseudomonadota bacterium]